MKKFIYKCAEEACEENWPESEYLYGSTALYEMKNDVPIRLVATDGGEPEDQTFNRDWWWVVDELNAAVKAALPQVVYVVHDDCRARNMAVYFDITLALEHKRKAEEKDEGAEFSIIEMKTRTSLPEDLFTDYTE